MQRKQQYCKTLGKHRKPASCTPQGYWCCLLQKNSSLDVLAHASLWQPNSSRLPSISIFWFQLHVETAQISATIPLNPSETFDPRSFATSGLWLRSGPKMAKTPNAIAVCTHKQKQNNKDLLFFSKTLQLFPSPKTLPSHLGDDFQQSLPVIWRSRQVQIPLIGFFEKTHVAWQTPLAGKTELVHESQCFPFQSCSILHWHNMDTSERIDGERAQSFSAIEGWIPPMCSTFKETCQVAKYII